MKDLTPTRGFQSTARGDKAVSIKGAAHAASLAAQRIPRRVTSEALIQKGSSSFGDDIKIAPRNK